MAISKIVLEIDGVAAEGWLENADMVHVVRCEKCKWYDKHDKRCKVWNHGVLSIGYCYRGEEREDETVD